MRTISRKKEGWPTCVKYWLQFIDSGLVSWWSHGVLGALLCTYCAPLASAPGRSAASGEPLAALTGLQMFSSIEFALWAASSIVRFWWIIARRVGRTPFRDWWFVLLGLAVVRALVGLTARDRGVGGLRISRPRLNIGGRAGQPNLFVVGRSGLLGCGFRQCGNSDSHLNSLPSSPILQEAERFSGSHAIRTASRLNDGTSPGIDFDGQDVVNMLALPPAERPNT